MSDTLTAAKAMTTASKMTAGDIMAAALALEPQIRERGDEIAELRRLPPDLVHSLKAAGAYRMLMPRAWGGPEMTPREQCEVIEIYARGDASVGWCVMIGSDSGLFAGYFEESAARDLYSELDFSFAGSGSAMGRAVRAPGGFLLNGRWPFGSNINNADVVTAICPVFEGETMSMVDGRPEMIMAAAPAASFEILDTWRTLGLAGTGSNDYVAKDLFVPDAHIILGFPTCRPKRPEPLYAWLGVFLANVPGVPLGLARRAIDVVKTMAGQKRQANWTRASESLLMKEVPRVRSGVAKAEMLLGAARAYVYQTLDQLWDEICRDGEPSRETRVALAASRQFALRTAREVVQLMVDTAGASAVYRTSPLERLLRDAITMCEHWTGQERTLEMIGAIVFGDEPIPGLL